MKIIATNKRAFFDYQILDTYEAGIALTGDEVKSLRKNSANLSDAFAVPQGGEMVLLNCYIAPYANAYNKLDAGTRRTRKLLLKKKEILKLIGDVSRKGLTIVPLKIYFSDRGFVKVEIGIAKHKNLFNKKQAIKERDLDRETSRAIKNRTQD